MDQDINIETATREDAAMILDLQQCAYQTEAAIYNDFTLPPLLETLDEIRECFRTRRFLKAMKSDRIVGSVRAFLMDITCYIERLIVHPDCRNRGIGTALMNQIESSFSTADRFELFTGHKSVKNLRLYKRLGYRPFRRDPVNERVALIFLEKIVPTT